MIGTFETTIVGIPCQIAVESYYRQSPQGKWADSDWDADGYTEIEYEIRDRKGYKADWLAKKVTDRIADQLEQQIINWMEN